MRVGGNWGIEGNALTRRDKNGRAFLIFNRPVPFDFDINFRAVAVSGSEGFAVLFKYTDDGNFSTFATGSQNNQGYALDYRINGEWGRNPGMFFPAGVEYGRWHEVRIEIRGATHRCYLDGNLLFTEEEPRLGPGRIGFGSWNTAVKFSDLVITDPAQNILWRGFPTLASTNDGSYQLAR